MEKIQNNQVTWKVIAKGWFSQLSKRMKKLKCWNLQDYTEIQNNEMGGENQELVEEIYCVIVQKGRKYYIIGTNGTYTTDYDADAIEPYDEIKKFYTFQPWNDTMIYVQMKNENGGSYFATSRREAAKLDKIICEAQK